MLFMFSFVARLLSLPSGRPSRKVLSDLIAVFIFADFTLSFL